LYEKNNFKVSGETFWSFAYLLGQQLLCKREFGEYNYSRFAGFGNHFATQYPNGV
jgi:hypothetical protein